MSSIAFYLRLVRVLGRISPLNLDYTYSYRQAKFLLHNTQTIVDKVRCLTETAAASSVGDFLHLYFHQRAIQQRLGRWRLARVVAQLDHVQFQVHRWRQL